jgi:protein-S-isoprenylcysteine O-methyltransferase Ste14
MQAQLPRTGPRAADAVSVCLMSLDMPALIVGVVVLIYWGRVARMAYKQRRRYGRGANFLPPERIGRLLRIIWIPAVFVWIVHPMMTGVFLNGKQSWWVERLVHWPWLAWMGAVIVVLSLLLTFLCWRKMGKSWRMGIDPSEKTHLVVEGPFQWVRHPIYALSSLMMLASLAVVPSPLMLAAGAVHLLLLQWEARREERHLIGQHGDAYIRYCAEVGRFLPMRLRRS